jgi:hypothetical protein
MIEFILLGLFVVGSPRPSTSSCLAAAGRARLSVIVVGIRKKID